MLQDGHALVVQRVSERDPTELATTVITLQEQITGWYGALSRSRKKEEMERVYGFLI
jgi:hypothetical protein